MITGESTLKDKVRKNIHKVIDKEYIKIEVFPKEFLWKSKTYKWALVHYYKCQKGASTYQIPAFVLSYISYVASIVDEIQWTSQ